jgi:hypothetical protein
MVDQHDGAPAAAGDKCRHHARGTGSYDSNIKYMRQFRVPATKISVFSIDRAKSMPFAPSPNAEVGL